MIYDYRNLINPSILHELENNNWKTIWDSCNNAVTEMNVNLTMQKIRDRSVVLREMLNKCEIGMVGAMYDVSTGKVTFNK